MIRVTVWSEKLASHKRHLQDVVEEDREIPYACKKGGVRCIRELQSVKEETSL